jgi:apolipoprotein N-acyltransferase
MGWRNVCFFAALCFNIFMTENEQKKHTYWFWLLVPLAGLVLESGYELSKYAKFSFLFATIPLLIFIYFCNSKKAAFFGGLLAGFVFFAATLRWFLAVFPLYWIGINNDYQGILIVMSIWFFSAIAFALGIALFSLSFYVLKKNSWHDLFIAPFLWVIFEYLRPYFFETVWWSPDGMFGAHWTNGVMGYLLTDWPVSKMAKLTGLYGLSFFVVFLNLTILFVFAGKKILRIKKTRADVFLKAGVTFVIALFIFLPLVFWRDADKQNSKKIYVSSLQLSDKYDFSAQDIEKLYQKYPPSEDAKEIPQMMVFPEESQLLAITGPQEKIIFENIFRGKKDSLLITGALKMRKNTIMFKDAAGEMLAEQKKELLMPFGEYLPALAIKAITVTSADTVTQNFNILRLVKRSTEPVKPYISENFKIGALSCSGILSNILYRNMTQNGAELLVNQASYGLFNDDPFSFAHVLTAARMRAIENDRYFIQSSASAVSFVLDNNGKIINVGEPGNDQFVNEKVYARSDKNFFVRYGNWIITLSLIIILIRSAEFVILTMRKNIKKTS